jgi:hypothetical protein
MQSSIPQVKPQSDLQAIDGKWLPKVRNTLSILQQANNVEGRRKRRRMWGRCCTPSEHYPLHLIIQHESLQLILQIIPKPISSFTFCWRNRNVFITESSIYCHITLCSPLKVNQCFRGTCHLHLQVWIISQAISRWGFLLGVFFNSENGYMFLWNVGWLSMDYVAFYPIRQNSS